MVNYTSISCPNGSPLHGLEEKNLCLDYTLIIFITLSIVAFMVAILITIYFHYKPEIEVYCYSSRWIFLQRLVLNPDKVDDKKYDAFVSFSHDDEQFVSEILVPGLEQNDDRKYKLCLHYRDWTPGVMINSQIFESIQNSRRTIVVLSPGYMKSVWGAMEFKTAHAEGFREGTTKVIVILYKDIGPIENYDEELMIYLKLNTYVKWGSPWFWQQLYYALPHPNKDSKKVINAEKYLSTARKYSMVLDLIIKNEEQFKKPNGENTDGKSDKLLDKTSDTNKEPNKNFKNYKLKPNPKTKLRNSYV